MCSCHCWASSAGVSKTSPLPLQKTSFPIVSIHFSTKSFVPGSLAISAAACRVVLKMGRVYMLNNISLIWFMLLSEAFFQA